MASSTAVSFPNLPSEILFKICQESARRDLTNFRLACSKFSSIAVEELFSTVYLTNSLKSFQKLKRISEHPVFRKYVKILDTDRRTFCSHYADRSEIHDFDDWKDKHAGVGVFENEGMGPGTRVMACSEPELRCHYAKWLEYLEDEMSFVWGTDIFSLLPNIIKQFPNLSSVLQTAMLQPGSTRKGRPSYESSMPLLDRSRFAEDTLSAPEMLAQFTLRPKPWNILQSLYLAKKTSAITAIDGFDLHLSNFTPESYPHAWEFPALKTLTLIVYHKDQWNASTYGHMLSRCPKLQELRLIYRGSSPPPSRNMLRLSFIASGSEHWARLRSISLEHLALHGSQLKSLLSSHKSSLRSLLLRDITILSETRETHNLGEEMPVSWLDIIEYLKQEMFLTSVELSGLLSD
ncbi:hypothetical protein VTL71DRAFT_8002 [Oculimacula yallundae]|uniref:F-box domain-containing protein n=1 Tax=Oculimacula yallundae TaxID=86028 RepID=A0ABR4CYT3_9HELO